MTILGNTRRPDVSFYSNGRIDITARAAKQLNLHDGDVVDIAAIDGECYIYVKHLGTDVMGRHEAACYPTKRGSNNYRCHSVRLTAFILQQHNGARSVKLPVGEPEQKPTLGIVLPIITRINLDKR